LESQFARDTAIPIRRFGGDCDLKAKGDGTEVWGEYADIECEE